MITNKPNSPSTIFKNKKIYLKATLKCLKNLKNNSCGAKDIVTVS